MRTRLARVLLLCSLFLSVGCAIPQPTTLQGMQDLEARKLALQCWADREGERLVFGAHATFTACNRWAHQVMALRYPAAPAAVRAFN